MSNPSNQFESLLLSQLANGIDSGDIAVATGDSQVFSTLLARYPTTSFGIDWPRLRHYRSCLSPQPKQSVEQRLPEIDRFLRQFAVDASIANNDKVIVVGDGVTDITLEMPLNLLFQHLLHLLTMPQHTYIIRIDYQWCFCYSFEDDMHYGEKP